MKRDTAQRRAIERAFRECGHAMTPPQALAAAERFLDNLSLPTIYRNLKRMREEGVLRSFQIPGERATYYELADQEHHHHFICRRCSRLYPVDCLSEIMRKLLPRGFVLEGHDVQLYGLCDSCGGKEGH